MGARGRGIAAVTIGALLLSVTAFAAVPVQVQWPVPVLVSEDADSDPDVRLTSSADGSRVAAVWTDGTQVWAAGSDGGGASWSTPAAISGTDAVDQDSVAVTASDDGLQVRALWYTTGSPNAIVTAGSTDGGRTWAAPVGRNVGPTALLSSNPALAGSADGTRLTAAWAVDVGSDPRVVRASSSDDASATWSTAPLSDPAKSADSPQLAMAANGLTVAALFTQEEGAQDVVVLRRSTDGGVNWLPAQPLSDGSASSPAITVSADGSRMHAVWMRSGGPESRIEVRSSTDGGANWSPAEPVSDAGQDATTPSIVASADGLRATVVWQRSDGADERIQSSSTADAGGTWSAPITQSPAGARSDNAAVATSDDGERVTAVWYRQDPGNPVVESVSSADGGDSWSPVALLSDPAQTSGDPDVAVSADGRRLITAWGGSDGTPRVWSSAGALFTPPSAPTGTTALAGEFLLTASWTPPVDTGGKPITGYTATAFPGGAMCTTTTQTSCTIPGLANGTVYTVTVTATNAIGTGPASAASNPVTPLAPVVPAPPPPPAPQPPPPPAPEPEPEPEDPSTKVVAKAKDGKDKLKVTVKPDLGKKKQWEFVVKVKKDGDWRKLKTKKGKTKVYETEGPDHRLTLDLDKGKYKATSKAARGYTADTSDVVKLTK